MRAPDVLLALALAGWATAAFALPAEDPLKSPACAEALERLQATPRSDPAQVQRVRQEAAQTCFGTAAAAPPGRAVQPPLVVPPVRIAPPAGPSPAPRLAPPPVDIGRAPAPVQCTPAGCWVHEGSHPRLVPAVPGFGCQPQGGVVYCP